MASAEQVVHNLLHSPELVRRLTEAAETMCSDANGMAATKDAEYRVVVQNDDGSTRARAFVTTANYQAVVDEKNHSTLHKAWASAR